MANYGVVAEFKAWKGYGFFNPLDAEGRRMSGKRIFFHREEGREILRWVDGEPVFKHVRDLVDGKLKRVRLPQVGDRIVYQLGERDGRSYAEVWGYAPRPRQGDRPPKPRRRR